MAAEGEGRLIIYGDVHGCFEEWSLLRDKIGIRPGDIEVSVGDLVDRGPFPLECLRLAREKGILAVKGNHEDRYIRFGVHERKFRQTGKKNPMAEKFPAEKREFFDSLAPADLEFMETFPLFRRFGNICVIHGGLTPTTVLQEPVPKDDWPKILKTRYLDAAGKMLALGEEIDPAKKAVFWSSVYDGSQGFIVFGHHPVDDLIRSEHALGIDTSCAFGGKLTGIILGRSSGTSWDIKNPAIVQVASMRKYHERAVDG